MPRSIHRPDDHYIVMPPDLYRMLDAAYHFARNPNGTPFDPCPLHPDFDGLKIPWPDRTCINPPFTSDYGSKTAFIRKAIAESKQGKDIFGVISSLGQNSARLAGASFTRLTPQCKKQCRHWTRHWLTGFDANPGDATVARRLEVIAR
jgi:hypothetical protein